ncbi:MAG: repressor LexA [Anaerolineaceae bacterium]|nr:repressor LexA [Anaerolineaceae bacterium]
MPRKNAGLGERHQKIMDFLFSFQEEFGYSPSIRQIGENIGVKSTSLVDYYLKRLVALGYIERDQHISRSIRLMDPLYEAVGKVSKAISEASDLLNIPIAGRIVASEPLPMPDSDLSYFDPESSVEIARSLLPANEKINELFALEVDGDSMIDAMVNDGDLVILKHAQEARNGEMVAVWLDDNNETTLKYFYKESIQVEGITKVRVRLQPANPNMEPIIINNPEHLRIMGKVVMVIRQVNSMNN